LKIMLNSTLRFIQKLWVPAFVVLAFYAGEPALAASGPGDVVGKVTVGYQAWFGAIGDGSPQNSWWHWADNGGQIFSPTNAQDVNSWPDMTDYTVSYQTGFANLGNGQPAKVFSSYDQSTVNAQISWMQTNGIDTIALQRFNPNSGETNRNGEAVRTNNAAITYGRKWFVMYDITGWTTADGDVQNDWTTEMSAYASSSAYAHQNGLPVVAVWLATSTLSESQLLDIVNWLRGQGLYVILGVERAWTSNTAMLPVYNAANMIQPWMIGSIGNISDADNNYNTYMVPDLAYCKAHGLDYQDVVIPGDLHARQRVHGNLMWEMFYNAVRLPTQGIYVSMYDEYGEGNMIAKTPDTSAGIPAGSTYLPLNEDGTYCTTDYYLRLTGAGDRMFKGLMPLSVVRPTYPGGAQRLVPGATIALKEVANGDYVCGSPLLANCTTVGQQESYQVVDAGNGNIALLSLANNEYVSADNGGASNLTADQTAIGTSDTFTEVDAGGGNIGLLAMANGKYVSAGSSPLIANSTSVGTSNSFTVVAGSAAAEGPYGGTPGTVPGTVLAEKYDTGGQGVGYNVTSINGTDNGFRPDGVDLETTTAVGGGNDIGWTAAGQWFRYTVNVATAGTYMLNFEVASPLDGVADGLHLVNSAGTNLTGPVNIPATGGYQDWAPTTTSVTLPAGQQVLTVIEDAGGYNLYSLTFTLTSSGGEGPYPGPSAAAIPGTVLNENYDTGGQGVSYNVTSTNGTANTYRAQGVDLEAATAPATGNDLGWSAAGQWFRYTVNASTAGSYTVSFLVASPTAVADAFHLSNSSGANLSGSVAVPATGGYQTWVTVTVTVTLPAGTQTLTLNDDAAGWNIDSMAFASSGGGTTEGPYPGPAAAAVPGTVMSENYDTGGQGVAYNVTSTNGTANTYRSQGVDLEAASAPATGNDLGWSAAGQWFRYTVNVSTAGSYTVSFLVASPTAVADAFHLSNSSGTNLSGSVAVPATGGYQTWTTVKANVTLPAGTQTLTLSEDAAGWNIDSMAFASGGGTGTPVIQIDCGGAASGAWVADTDFTGGTAVTATNTITTTGVTNPAPQAVYQSNRYNAPTYTIGGLTAGTSYTVRLHFAETYWTAAGQREFNVSINGAQVLTNFDIFATAGGENIATVKQFTATANSSGQIVITSTNVVDNAQFNGIEVDH
jgi:hypothetical protein